MPGKMRVVSQTGDLEDPATKAEASPKGPNHQVAQPSMPDAAPPPKPGGRPWRRRVLFALLPLVLVGGGYWYATGGQTVSMDDAYVEFGQGWRFDRRRWNCKGRRRLGIQHVEPGQVLYRLDDLPFQLAVARADAQIGVVRDALNALKANYRDMQAQIDQAHNDVGYYETEFQRQQGPQRPRSVSSDFRCSASEPAERAAKVASLAQQLAAIAANLDGDPTGPVEKFPATSMQWRSETRPHDNWRTLSS